MPLQTAAFLTTYAGGYVVRARRFLHIQTAKGDKMAEYTITLPPAQILRKSKASMARLFLMALLTTAALAGCNDKDEDSSTTAECTADAQ